MKINDKEVTLWLGYVRPDLRKRQTVLAAKRLRQNPVRKRALSGGDDNYMLMASEVWDERNDAEEYLKLLSMRVKYFLDDTKTVVISSL